MSTTSILSAFLEQVSTLATSLSLPVAWPGLPKVPPSSGMWLEVKHFPNEPIDIGWKPVSHPVGFFQVSVCFRPGTNTGQNSLIAASTVADQVISAFPAETEIDETTVRKQPWQSPAIDLKDKSFIPVTIPYRWAYTRAVAGEINVLNSAGTSFGVGFAVLDSDGNSFTVTSTVLDSDGNSFTVT